MLFENYEINSHKFKQYLAIIPIYIFDSLPFPMNLCDVGTFHNMIPCVTKRHPQVVITLFSSTA